MNKLTSLAEYSDYLTDNFTSDIKKWRMHRIRTVFGRQDLELWMFFPCKLVKGLWVIFEEPKEGDYNLGDIHAGYFGKDVEEYKKAVDKCLFEGFEYCNKWLNTHVIAYDKVSGIGAFYLSDFKTVEDLVRKKVVEITDTAQKQLGL
jgi:hypothetical protein